MIIRSKAPLRLGLAGGGTDVSPYSDEFGGFVLNSAINMYAYCTLDNEPTDRIVFEEVDKYLREECAIGEYLEPDGPFALHKAVYNRVVRDFLKRPFGFTLSTYSDAAAGSGLGGSSTLVVAMLHAYVEHFSLPLGDYDTAHLAYEIERVDVGFAGGKQDQYAATFGGFNFMEFYADRVVVNPLRIKEWIINELESSMLIYFTGISRQSARIIEEQINNTRQKESKSIEAMHELERDAVAMKEAILTGNLAEFARILNHSWAAKKRTAASIANDTINHVYETAMQAGAVAGKVSGAGGGGYFMFAVEPHKKPAVRRALENLGGKVDHFQFERQGAQSWRILKKAS